MNLERFLAVIEMVRDEIDESETPDQLSKIIALLEKSNTADDSNSESEYQTSLLSLKETLTSAPSNEVPPSIRQTIRELQAERYLGIGLLNAISKIESQNTVTKKTAIGELKKLHKELLAFQKRVTNTGEALSSVGVVMDDIHPGQAEVGVVVPRSFLKDDIGGMQKELRRLELIFKKLAKVTKEDTGLIVLKSIGSSDWGIFLGVSAAYALLFSKIIKQCLNIVNSHLDARKKIKQLVDTNQFQSGLVDTLESQLKDNLKNIVEGEAQKIVYEYGNQNDADVQEQIRAVSITMKEIISRVSAGITFEARAKPTQTKVMPEGEAGPSGEIARDMAQIEEEQARLKELNKNGACMTNLPVWEQPVALLEPPAESELEGGSANQGNGG